MISNTVQDSTCSAFRIAYSCYFGLRGNLDFPDFRQKKFYNIDYSIETFGQSYKLSAIVSYSASVKLTKKRTGWW